MIEEVSPLSIVEIKGEGGGGVLFPPCGIKIEGNESKEVSPYSLVEIKRDESGGGLSLLSGVKIKKKANRGGVALSH